VLLIDQDGMAVGEEIRALELLPHVTQSARSTVAESNAVIMATNYPVVMHFVNNQIIDWPPVLVYPANMRRKKSAPAVEPTDTITSIFTARRDLLQGVKSAVAGSGFTVEAADLLVSLYGVRELGWDDLPHDEGGFVAYKELEQFLVHNPSLLSRRIRKLADMRPPLVEVGKPEAGSGLHFNALCVRITAEGIKRMQPVWERFARMSANLLQGIPPHLLKGHYEVNEQISARIRARRQSAKDFLVNA